MLDVIQENSEARATERFVGMELKLCPEAGTSPFEIDAVLIASQERKARRWSLLSKRLLSLLTTSSTLQEMAITPSTAVSPHTLV